MDGLRTRALLRVGADGELLLTFGAASGVDLLRRVEQVVVGLGRSADVGEIAAEEQPQLGEDRPAERQDAFLAALAVDAERAAVRVEVADLDAGELAAPDAEQEQAEQRQAVARVLARP